MAWTGLTAAALWRAADQRWEPGALGRLTAIYLLAVMLHTAWDSAVNPLVYLIIALISLVALAMTAHRLAAPEHRDSAASLTHTKRPRAWITTSTAAWHQGNLTTATHQAVVIIGERKRAGEQRVAVPQPQVHAQDNPMQPTANAQ